MKAQRLFYTRENIQPRGFVEISVWEVPAPVRGSEHVFKYSLAFIVDGKCVLRYDNEAGKGDHKHIGNQEVPYAFSTIEQLFDDFMADVDQWSE